RPSSLFVKGWAGGRKTEPLETKGRLASAAGPGVTSGWLGWGGGCLRPGASEYEKGAEVFSECGERELTGGGPWFCGGGFCARRRGLRVGRRATCTRRRPCGTAASVHRISEVLWA